MAKTYYEILSLKATATQEEIKRAYRKKAMESHPDVNASPGATEVFVQINEAYAILSDAQKRQVYNQKLRDEHARSAGVSYAQNMQGSHDATYRQWVQQAQAQAAANARMNYQDFKRTRFMQVEESVFLYLQFVVLGVFFLLGLLMLLLPFAAMFYVNWKVVFSALIFIPIAFKIFEEGWKGLKELRASL
jgi:DnaJ-class molecular chaperone